MSKRDVGWNMSYLLTADPDHTHIILIDIDIDFNTTAPFAFPFHAYITVELRTHPLDPPYTRLARFIPIVGL